ncbi:hypothetical protein GOBAR_AA07165 [Gossypium barbadense]|uniref:Uncharacterized protein n=1 Tax=Gossypium barbadense TaxID=3634 RepID=A0A2P5YCX6_GOSBA|nr:hypothetical protein GOBAR_AA07165 [Gossypium barbadense]
MPRPCDMAVVEPAKTKGSATRLCGRTMDEPANTARACNMPVSNTRGTMSSSREKKTAIPASKNRKGASSSSTEEEDYEDIFDDVPPQHEDPSTQPPPPSHPVHAATSYACISERLTRFKHQCFQ